MAEQRYRKPQVAGSTPVTSSKTNATLYAGYHKEVYGIGVMGREDG